MICDVCHFPINEQDGVSFCSEFCITAPAAEREALTTRKAGDFCLWPCSICGCAVEDEYTPGGNCGGCEPKRRRREAAKVLRNAKEDAGAVVEADEAADWCRRYRVLLDGIDAALRLLDA